MTVNLSSPRPRVRQPSNNRQIQIDQTRGSDPGKGVAP
jgi:hypothetical protein